MFIQTEATPNPSTLKFIPGREVMANGTYECRSITEAEKSPLASALFSIGHISSVFFGSDFISVTKSDGEWQNLKPSILGAIMDHFTSGHPLLLGDDFNQQNDFIGEENSPIVEQISQLIEQRVRPAVAGDGGDIVLRGFKDGVVYLKMKGACSGCPSSTATLKNGIQNLLRHYVPEVQSVEQI